MHPQKRLFIKRVLESTMTRICEMKKDLCLFNPRPKSIYVHLDQLLFDLKYDPSIIEIPVPQYFKEDDKIKVELAFKEKVERDAKKKKGGRKPKKPKKKKKTEDEPKPEPKSMKEKEFLIDKILKQEDGITYQELFATPDPEPVVLEDGEEADPNAVVPEKLPKFIIRDEVVREDKMHYFNVPRLGSYMAIKLEYDSCLSIEAFDAALSDF